MGRQIIIPGLLVSFLVGYLAIAINSQNAEETYRNGGYPTAFKENGRHVEKDTIDAQSYFGLSYGLGHTVPQNYETSAEWYKLAAEEGDAIAQVNMGIFFHHGVGVQQDYGSALKWYSLSAEQGNADAQTLLGVMYREGHGVRQDYETAAKWLKLGAEQGNAFAQKTLGSMFFNGHGLPQDYTQAHIWWTIASSHSHSTAKSLRDMVEKNMKPAQIQNAQRLAREWMVKMHLAKSYAH